VAFTMPEGVPQYTPTPVSEFSMPQTVRFEPPRQTSVGSASFLVVISTILGILIATGSVLGVVGKAFYVERSEYNLQVVTNTEERVKVAEALKRIDQSVARQEAAIEKISECLETLKQDSRRRGR